MAKSGKIPRFHGFRIYFTATMLYFLLVMPIAGILMAKYSPEWLENRETETESQLNDSIPDLITDTLLIDMDTVISIPDTFDVSIPADTTASNENIVIDPESTAENKFTDTINLLFRFLVISFVLGLAFNLPFKIYFRRLRRGKKIAAGYYKFIRKLILKTPIINVGILFLSYGGILIYMLSILFFNNNFDEITQRFYLQLFFISALASLLTLMFVYFWEKHRVHIKYIEHVFPLENLRQRIFRDKAGKISGRLWISSAMTTLLPLIIVVFYLFLSITSLSDLNITELSDQHKSILFGKYLAYFTNLEISSLSDLFYVNVLDSVLMLTGIFTGIFVAIIYILFFVNWITNDIVQPVNELLRNMEKTGKGEMDQFSIVRTNDEIGVLTEGYNDMSQKIKDYITSISRINEANSRFVPRQFLEYLGKESIAEINLGDQVQKEMTVLFCDIRNFTTISEEMTPRENFNFLNNYLGYMEPIIRKNKGFIDKYIGDSIMALFSERTEDALNAAIEMRIKLLEFNQVMQQFGKPPVDNGFGIHTGNLMLGVVGGEGRMDGTVISDAVNLSSRLEGLTKIYGASIIISQDTLIKINDPGVYDYRFLDIVKVKGKQEAVYIFEVLNGEPEKTRKLKIKTKAEFGQALQLYKNMQFEKALEEFIKLYTINPDDRAVFEYITRCKKNIRDGVTEEWDGVERIDDKFN